MKLLLEYAGWVVFSLYSTLGANCHFRPEIMRPLALLLVLTPFIGYRRGRGQASDLDLGLIAYFLYGIRTTGGGNWDCCRQTPGRCLWPRAPGQQTRKKLPGAGKYLG